jgi:hypothetical protein
VDAFFIAVFVAHGVWVAPEGELALVDRRWHIGRERSYAEILGYLKLTLIAGLLLAIGSRRRTPLYLAFVPIWGFALLDDAFEVHEQLGEHIASGLALPSVAGLRGQDLGELAVWMIVGGLLVPAVLLGYLRSRQADRRNGLLLLGMFALLLLFAVAADMVHIVVGPRSATADLLLTVLEDGGEQIVLTVTLGLTVLIHRELRRRELRGAPSGGLVG